MRRGARPRGDLEPCAAMLNLVPDDLAPRPPQRLSHVVLDDDALALFLLLSSASTSAPFLASPPTRSTSLYAPVVPGDGVGAESLKKEAADHEEEELTKTARHGHACYLADQI